jgi:hypothetical protein
MPHALRPNTYNNGFETNFIKVAFGNGGHVLQQLLAYLAHIGFWHECN